MESFAFSDVVVWLKKIVLSKISSKVFFFWQQRILDGEGTEIHPGFGDPVCQLDQEDWLESIQTETNILKIQSLESEQSPRKTEAL